jgi:hypothetical protein
MRFYELVNVEGLLDGCQAAILPVPGYGDDTDTQVARLSATAAIRFCQTTTSLV